MQLAVTSRAKYNKRYLYSIAAISVRQNDFIVGGGRWKEDPDDFSFRVPFVTELLRFNFFFVETFLFFLNGFFFGAGKKISRQNLILSDATKKIDASYK